MHPLGLAPAFKLVLMGQSGVGKTSIVQYFETQAFDPGTDATIGASFVSREMSTPSGLVNLHIWDTAGQERFRSLVPTYVRGACAAVLVFDVALPSTFHELDFWMSQFRESNEFGIVYVVGNKSDLPAQIFEDDVKKWAEADSLRTFFVSAKTGQGIDRMFQDIAEDLSAKRPHVTIPNGGTEPAKPAEAEKRCC
jgi:small GTP-binding protein